MWPSVSSRTWRVSLETTTTWRSARCITVSRRMRPAAPRPRWWKWSPQRLGDHFRHLGRGAAGRILLETVMHLADLHVVVVSKETRHVREDTEGHIHPHAHIGRQQDGNLACQPLDLFPLCRRETRGADHR